MAYRATQTETATVGQVNFLVDAPFAPGQQVIVQTNPNVGLIGTDSYMANPVTGELLFFAPFNAGDVIDIHIWDEQDVVSYIDSDLLPRVENLGTDMEDVKAATYGSWIWDKTAGIMTMYDVFGGEKFKFAVSDSSDEAFRERRQDLEQGASIIGSRV